MKPDADSKLTDEASAVTEPEQSQFAKLVLEAGPLVVFFVSNAYLGIFPATGAFMVATILALVVSRLKFGRIPVMPLVSGFFVLSFGSIIFGIY